MKRLLLVGLFAQMCVACASTRDARIPIAGLPGQVQLEALRRDQYEVGPAVTGSHCAISISLVPLPVWWSTADEAGTVMWGWVNLERFALQGAVFNALATTPAADFLTAPRIKISHEKIGPWYEEYCYEISARTARLKGDPELPARSLDVDIEVKETIGAAPGAAAAPAPRPPVAGPAAPRIIDIDIDPQPQ